MSWAIPRFDLGVNFAGASHAGRVRTSNEDVWRVDPGLGLFAVADGMGGHAAGEIAARIAVTQLGHAMRTPEAHAALDAFAASPTLEARRTLFEVLRGGAARAHAAVLQTAAEDARRRGMGCTLDAALLVGNRALLIHAGDGRSYLARATTTIQLTQDHTLHGALVERGLVSPSDRPKGAGALTNAVGRKGTLEMDEIFVELGEGDRLLLCTDGVHNELGDESVISELTRRSPIDDTAVAIVNAAVEHGGRDNATALVLEVGARRVDRSAPDEGLAARDRTFAAHSPLLSGMRHDLVLRALHAAVEIEFEPGEIVPRFSAEDRVGYIVLEGRIDAPSGWAHGPSSLVYAESLGGGGTAGTPLSKAVEPTRVLRIRANDFREICASDAQLAAQLYERLSHVLSRTPA